MYVLITEPNNYSARALDIYKKIGSVLKLDEKRSGAIINNDKGRVGVIVVRNLTQVNKEFIDKFPNLKIVASPTTGLNHIDVGYLKKKKIKLISLRGRKSFLKNITSTAEHAMGLLLALVRHMPWSFDEVKKGNWPRNEFIGHQLSGGVLGILGYGRLGRMVARYAKSFGMEVIACDPYVSFDFMEKHGVKKVDMDSLFKLSDFVSIDVLLTEKTYNLVKERHLKLMKRESFLVNTARGEIIKRDALFKALKNKWIKGAAIDVMWDERKDGGHLKKDSLWGYAKKNKNLLITSHLGGVSYEAMATTEDFVAGLVFSYLNLNK